MMFQPLFCFNLPQNPYFKPFLQPNDQFLGLATFTKVDSLIKMSHFSFIKFSQKLDPQDLQNSLREPTFLNKVLCIKQNIKNDVCFFSGRWLMLKNGYLYEFIMRHQKMKKKKTRWPHLKTRPNFFYSIADSIKKILLARPVNQVCYMPVSINEQVLKVTGCVHVKKPVKITSGF